MSFKAFLILSGKFIGMLLLGIFIAFFGFFVIFSNPETFSMTRAIIGLIITVFGLLVAGYAWFKHGGGLNKMFGFSGHSTTPRINVNINQRDEYKGMGKPDIEGMFGRSNIGGGLHFGRRKR